MYGPKKRKAIPFPKKQEALSLLGALSDGTQALPLLNAANYKPHKTTSVGVALRFLRPALYQWLEKRKEIIFVSKKGAKKLKNVREGDFTLFIDVAHTHIIGTINVLNGVSQYYEGEIKVRELVIRDQLLIELKQRR